MHFSAFFVGLSALVITSLAMPAPETTAEALPVPATMAVAAEIPYQTAGPFAGVLPPNFAKVWVYTGLECGVRDGPSYNMNFISGQDRCIPFRNVGSIIAWYKSSIGPEGVCAAKAHSVPDPIHADGALCPVELGVLDKGSPASGDAAPLLSDWAFVPNDTVAIVAGDRERG
ncbi:unnamed protein product [Alternaria alternata]|nr:hypothetical protein AA0116_g1029 [Alternaria tenuissima]